MVHLLYVRHCARFQGYKNSCDVAPQEAHDPVKTSIRFNHRDFPGGPVVKNSPCSTGDAGLIPDQGTKIPYAAGQRSPLSATSGLTCHNKRSHVLQQRPDAA